MSKKIIGKIKSLSEKNKIILRNVSGAFFIKGLALFISFFSMPIYIRFFNDEAALGIWFTILSVLTWVLNFDLGIGNGLRNHLTESLTNRDKKTSKDLISSAYFSIGIVSIAMICIFWLISKYINWNLIFNIDESVVASKSLLLSIQIVFVGIAIQLALRLITSILYAMQHSSINNLLALLTSLITVVTVLLLPSKTNDENIVMMAAVHIFAANVPLLVATIITFMSIPMKECAPSLLNIDWGSIKKVLSLGGVFFFIQIMYMLIMNTNDYLITLFSNSEDVVQYQIYYKVFFLGSSVFALALTPIWSVVTKAMAEKDYNWLRLLYSKMLKFALIGTVCEFIVIFFMQPFINVWLGNDAICVTHSYSITFAVLGSLMLYNSVMSSIANGMGALKTQVVCFSLGALIKIPIAYLLVEALDSWIGVVLSNAFVIAFYCIAQGIVLKKTLMLKLNEIEEA